MVPTAPDGVVGALAPNIKSPLMAGVVSCGVWRLCGVWPAPLCAPRAYF
jgi:hypothetical protein